MTEKKFSVKGIVTACCSSAIKCKGSERLPLDDFQNPMRNKISADCIKKKCHCLKIEEYQLESIEEI